MSDLPPERLVFDKPPFFNVEVDCFGLIYIEVLHSIETDTFINGFRRFISRRGTPSQIWSDNGTNFVVANSELNKSMKQLDQNVIHEYCLKIGVNWSFNPPTASPIGGVC